MPASQPETTASTQPLVFISYSHKDEKWRERLHLFLKPAEQSGSISVWDDRRIHLGDEWNTAIDEAIAQASVAVLLISPEYLASEWVSMKEIPDLLKRQQQGSLRIIPILLKPCNWNEADWLSTIQIFPSDGKPIAGRSKNTQDKLFKDVADYIVHFATGQTSTPTPLPSPPLETTTASQPPPVAEATDKTDELTVFSLSEFELSDEVKTTLHRAQVLATYAEKTPPLVTTSCLLFGMAEGGRGRSDAFKTPQFLWQEINKDGGEQYHSAFSLNFPNARYASTDGAVFWDSYVDDSILISPNTLKTFQLAAEISSQTFKPTSGRASKKIAAQTSGSQPLPRGHIAARHLLAALFLLNPVEGRTGAVATVLTFAPDAIELKKKFLDFIIIAKIPGDNHKAWAKILLADEEEIITEPEADAEIAAEVDTTAESEDGFRAPLAGFLADFWAGDDLLDITPDVNALAALIAAYSIEPPLSIGLFGDWGSGKSHFMRQLKKRVETLSSAARKSDKPQNQISYYKNIVQIEFNAWHYIEGNLWASLVEHIFAHLKFSDEENVTLAEARRAQLMEKIGINQQVLAKVEERKAVLKEQESVARQRATEAKDKRETLSESLRGLVDVKSSDLNKLILTDFSETQKELLKKLGIPEKALSSPAAVKKQYLETKKLWGRIRAQFNIFKKNPMRIVLLAGALILAVAVGFLLTPYLKRWFNSPGLGKLVAVITSVVTFLSTAWKVAKPYLSQVKQGLEVLEEKNQEIDDERQKRIGELEESVETLTRQYREAEGEADALNRQVSDLTSKIAGTTTSAILAEFIEDRAAASDYRRHLGVLALIRRDFEKLADLFAEQREEERGGHGVTDHKTINRIILYIDDLDRCPPERVVQVLQAIHLLLAFPLFVVVVGVDARWVTRSLQESYEWLRDLDGAEGEEEKDEKAMQGKGRGATPHDYLEKIFQIPFWLKPMGEKDCKKFIAGLTKNISPANAEAKQNGGAGVKAEDEPKPDVGITEPEKNNAVTMVSTPNMPPPDDAALTESNRDFGQAMPENATDNQTVSTNVMPETFVGIKKADDAPAEEKIVQEHVAKVEEEIDLETQNLKIEDAEVAYMQDLTPLIGRSPRAVKRFLNCYRLIKVGKRPAQLSKFIGADGQSGEYTAVMILLGVITGAPSVSSYFIEELEKWAESGEAGTLQTFLTRLQKNPEVSKLPDWARVQGFLGRFIKPTDAAEMLAKLVAVVPSVSRYSFRVARVETARQRKSQTRPQSVE